MARPLTLEEADLVLSPAELQAITGYTQPARQLLELHTLGYFRARRAKITGRVILERAHYDAVCRGEKEPPQRRPPALLPAPPKLRAA
ncbi:MAG: hypothetical protein RL375_1735 [Pseudomonadota bacterium]|jgi:hypothetical protein